MGTWLICIGILVTVLTFSGLKYLITKHGHNYVLHALADLANVRDLHMLAFKSALLQYLCKHGKVTPDELSGIVATGDFTSIIASHISEIPDLELKTIANNYKLPNTCQLRICKWYVTHNDEYQLISYEVVNNNLLAELYRELTPKE